jgi:pyruvate kinase
MQVSRDSTKIIATLGPASSSPDVIRSLLAAGADVFRINASHGTHGDHLARIRTVRRVAAECELDPGILLDLQGPKIRLGKFAGGSATLATGSRFTITTEAIQGDSKTASTTYAEFAKDVTVGNRVLLADGAVELRAIQTDGTRVIFEVTSGGIIKDQQGINLPGVRVSIPSLTPKDLDDLTFGLDNDVDLVALSFVRSAADVKFLRQQMEDRGKRVPIIAKIEKPEALDHLDSILEAADGVMVARGDLGVELALARVPGAQKTILERARVRGKFAITATQMLETMIVNPTPTRAEVNDVANAIFDGTDAVMLSAETASGAHPVEAVRMMDTIATEAEAYLGNKPFAEPPMDANPSHARIIAEAAYHAGMSANVKAIVVFTSSGNTARLVARYRPRVPIYALCETQETARALSVIYGVHTISPVNIGSIEGMVQITDLKLLGEAWSKIGDSVILVAGTPFGTPGSANTIRLHRIGEVKIQGSVE